MTNPITIEEYGARTKRLRQPVQVIVCGNVSAKSKADVLRVVEVESTEARCGADRILARDSTDSGCRDNPLVIERGCAYPIASADDLRPSCRGRIVRFAKP